MEDKLLLFKELALLFKSHGFNLFLVGGTVRDYLLNLALTDMDAVSDATPTQMEEFLKDADYTFKKYGSIKYIYKDIKFDITTLRKEQDYSDSRHPNKIEFTTSLEEDVKRRDISINAIYLDSDLKVIDLVGGVADLNKKIIRIIGNPDQRIKEDPLRIIRIYRFALDYNLDIDKDTEDALNNNFELINKLNVEKIKQEIKKSTHQKELNNLLKLVD